MFNKKTIYQTFEKNEFDSADVIIRKVLTIQLHVMYNALNIIYNILDVIEFNSHRISMSFSNKLFTFYYCILHISVMKFLSHQSDI